MNFNVFSGTTRLLDYKLQPIFDQIRKRNINNVHQLQTLNHLESNTEEYTTSVLPIFYPKTDRTYKLESLKLKPSNQRLEIIYKKQNSQSPKNSSLQKVFFVSSTSKVKKHLVQTIDYQGIEKALFKPKQRRTLYQQFYQTIVEKDRWIKRTNPGLFKTLSVDAKSNQQNETAQNAQIERRSIFKAAAKKINQRSIDRHKMHKLQSIELVNK